MKMALLILAIAALACVMAMGCISIVSPSDALKIQDRADNTHAMNLKVQAATQPSDWKALNLKGWFAAHDYNMQTFSAWAHGAAPLPVPSTQPASQPAGARGK